jgi:two-component system sensor histidine kinase UhpB
MKALIKILILEHDPYDIELLRYELKKSGLQHESKVVSILNEFRNALIDFQPHIILSDFSLPSFNAVAAFDIKQEICPDVPFIIVSGTVGEENAVELIKKGITDYALKDKLFTVIPKINRALEEFNARREKLVADKKLRDYSNQITDILESIGDGFFAVDENWTVTYWNRAAERSMNIKREDVVGKNLWEYFPDARSLLSFKKYHQAMEEKINVVFEDYYPPINKWFDIAAYPSPTGLSIYFKDITEKVEQGKKLSIATERYRILSMATNDTIWDWDIKINEVEWNEGIQMTFKYKKEQVGRDISWWHENIHPEDRARVLQKFYHHLDHNITHWQDEYRYRCADGFYKFVYDRGFLLFDENNHPYRMIGAMMDLSEQKQLENTLNEERIKHQKMLAKATIEGQEKERSEIGRELHDNINQILTTIKLYIELAIFKSGKDDELLNRGIHFLQVCIEEIRKMSKSLIPPTIKDISIVDSINELIESIRLTQVFTIDFRHSEFNTDNLNFQQHLALYRIVQEQLNNIVKYANASEVVVELSKSANSILLQISDNGIGFDPKEKRNGVGLMNIQNRAEVLNGSVEIVSSKGKGCFMTVLLPIEDVLSESSE